MVACGGCSQSQHRAPDALSFNNYLQTPVNSFAQETVGQALLGVSRFNWILSSNHNTNPNSGNDFTDLDWDFNAQQSFQDIIQEGGYNDMIPMPRPRPMPPFPSSVPTPGFLIPAYSSAPVVALPPVLPDGRFACTNPACNKTFKRDADRVRHEVSIHSNHPGAHLCPIPGCAKGQGKGFSRPDKVTEHLWKFHWNLGFVKRA